MIKILIILFMLIAIPAHAVGVQNVRVFPDRVEFDGAGSKGDVVVNYADIDASLVTQQNADKATAWLQSNVFDTVVKRSTLPADDADRISDPGSLCAFWSTGNNITTRNTIVTVFIENNLFNVRLETCDRANQ